LVLAYDWTLTEGVGNGILKKIQCNYEEGRDSKFEKITQEEFIAADLPPSIISDEIVKGEVGRTCGTHGEEEKCIQIFLWETPKERGCVENLGVNGRI
jgi:hypothetical protein